ncbi:MAG: hypothetical protein NC489_37520 [Ruminococcus flavefaciens]|nr:hypothetical protein [Ruminococcus flavefaciens]
MSKWEKPETTITIDKRIKLSPGETLERTASTEKRPKPTLDEQWQNISRQSQTHLKHGDLGLYACDLFSLSEIRRKEAHYDDQMKLLILSAYIHLSGISTITEYNYWKDGDFSVTEPMPLLPPAVIRSTKSCIKRLGIDLEQYRESYRRNVSPTLTPEHIFGIEKSLNIICTYLDGDNERADKMVETGTKKYIKEHSIKRR